MRRTTIGAAALAGASLITAMTAGPASAGGRITFSEGHLDLIDIAYEDGELEAGIHDEDGDVEYSADEVLLQVDQAAQVAVPADPAFGFLGDPGDLVSILPFTQDPELIWPGIAAEEVEAGVFEADSLEITLLRVRGPGEVAVYTEDAFGVPDVLLDSGDGLPDVTTVVAGSHQHQNWAFDTPGRYRVTFRVSGRLADTGESVRSDPTTLVFRVVP